MTPAQITPASPRGPPRGVSRLKPTVNRPTGPPRVFERLADDYRARPPYPDALVARLSELAGAGRRIVDLGAGTGLLAAPLARAGHAVLAVEPARAMLAVCAEACAGLPVTPVLAPAESTGLGDVQAGLVLLADATHSIRPDAAGSEAHRLLAPDGVAAVVAPEPLDTPFMRGLCALPSHPIRRPEACPQTSRTRQFLALAADRVVPGKSASSSARFLDPRGAAPGGPLSVLRWPRRSGPRGWSDCSARWRPSASGRAASGPGCCGCPGSGSSGVHAGLEGVHLGRDRGGDDACRRVVEGRAAELLRPRRREAGASR